MISRRSFLTGAVAFAVTSVAATTLPMRRTRELRGVNKLTYDHWAIRANGDNDFNPLGGGGGFGLAQPKPEGGVYYHDPMDDPNYRGPKGQGGKYT